MAEYDTIIALSDIQAVMNVQTHRRFGNTLYLNLAPIHSGQQVPWLCGANL